MVGALKLTQCIIVLFYALSPFFGSPAKLQVKTFLEGTYIATNYQIPVSDNLFVASLISSSFDAFF